MKLSRNIVWLCLFIVSALVGCGSSATGANAEPDRRPDKVQIQVFEVDPKGSRPAKTVTSGQADLVRQFYQTVNATPSYPENAVCTMELGPHYILTFSQGGKNMMTVTAERYGCQKVTLGKNDLRQGNQQFWQELDQLIAKAA